MKKGQLSVFVVVALVIVAGVLIFFLFKDRILGGEVSQELAPVFDFYQSCIEQETKSAITLAGAQGGYVEVPDYFPGSEYAPFSSHLNFLGNPVPFWYYVSGNGLIKEQVPSKNEIENQIARFVEEGIRRCDFESFNRQGFAVEKGEPEVKVEIGETKVNVDVFTDVAVSKGENSARKTSYNAELDSKLGKFYRLATEIYDREKKEAFFENIAVDVLYLYAPVDGVEIQCGPKIWSTLGVMSEIRNGLQENFATLKFNGDYYNLKNETRKYFVLDVDVDEQVNVMYSSDWPTKIEIEGEGVDETIMLAEAIGNQEGLGVIGFCYVPYHFVYDVSFPVMVQFYNNEELFQFPVVVVIDNNVARNALLTSNPDEEDFDLCEYKTQNVQINVYDINLNPVDANVSYECFNQRCRVGESKNGKVVGSAPACVNGFLHLRADGFAEKKELFSSNRQSSADVILDREFDVKLNLSIGGRELENGNAIVSFVRDDGLTRTATVPGVEKIKLSEGNYEVKVYVYGNSSIVIPGSTKTQCVDAPREGLLGFFGATEEKCFDINIPDTKIEHSLIGGGSLKSYILESDLEKGGLKIEAAGLPTPNSVEQLQKNFELFETRRINLEFYE